MLQATERAHEVWIDEVEEKVDDLEFHFQTHPKWSVIALNSSSSLLTCVQRSLYPGKLLCRLVCSVSLFALIPRAFVQKRLEVVLDRSRPLADSRIARSTSYHMLRRHWDWILGGQEIDQRRKANSLRLGSVGR